tara:strand:+ start:101677 stop:102669 length:993 start_codon:yes stop_codon:yes gene_type:complete
MRINKQKEKEFMDKEFNFSYSSMNRLLFSPKIFYKEYILQEKEVRTDKHLVEGKLLHLMLLQPEKLHEEFSIVPSKIPSDTLRKVLKNITLYTDAKELDLVEDKIILDSLKEIGLYQSLKDETKRIAKVRTVECIDYYTFEAAAGNKDVIDNDMLAKATERVALMKANDSIMKLFTSEVTDFEMDNLEVFNEKYLTCKLAKYKFGLHGYVDRYVIDHETKTITIIDLKTSGKSLTDFPDTLDFYRYWLQAAIYVILVGKNVPEKIASSYKISFKFVVIDKYDQTYAFDVSSPSLNQWTDNLHKILEMVNFHYTECKYELPYDFLKGNVQL